MPSMFYCHHCDRSVNLRNSDLVCASCGSDFIEEIAVPVIPGVSMPIRSVHPLPGDNRPQGSPFSSRGPQSNRSRSVPPPGGANSEPSQNENTDNRRPDPPNFLRPFLNIFNGFASAAPTPDGQNAGQQRSPDPRRGPHVHVRVERPQGANPVADQFLQDLAERIAGNQGGNISVQIRIDGQRPTVEIGDYAMGMDMDQILNNLMNQFGDGHPVQNLTEEQLESIPIVKVDQSHVDNKTQCSTCFEDFVLDESVARLNCTHIFHVDCVKPWLRTHNTCPMCRTEVNPSGWQRTQEARNDAIPRPPAAPSGMVDADELD